MVIRRWFPWLLGAALVSGCSPEAPRELRQAADVVNYMMQPSQISRSAFAAAFPEPRPSHFVSFIFSDMGAAEWPESEATSNGFASASGLPGGGVLLPEGVAFVPLAPDPGRGKQVVVSFDDQRGVVIVNGYLDPLGESVLRREWKLFKVDPAPGVHEIYRANTDMGISSQAF